MMCGPVRTTTVTNLVRFDPASTSFGKKVWVHAYLAIPSADYRIEICDTNMILLKTLKNHTERGVIDEVWDLRTADGKVRTNEEFSAEIYITPTHMDTNGFVRSNAPTFAVPYN